MCEHCGSRVHATPACKFPPEERFFAFRKPADPPLTRPFQGQPPTAEGITTSVSGAQPAPESVHNADKIGTSEKWPGMTRLEAAEQERRAAIRAELEQHSMNADQELGRHRLALDAIAADFGGTMGVA